MIHSIFLYIGKLIDFGFPTLFYSFLSFCDLQIISEGVEYMVKDG